MKAFPESCLAGDFIYEGKVETKSSHDLIISSGIDTLHMVYKLKSYNDSLDGHMPEDLKKYLLDARFLARSGKTKIVFCGEEFEIAKFGKERHQFQIFKDKYTIRIPSYANVFAYFSVEFRSSYLRLYGDREVDKRMKDLLSKVAVVDEEKVHRVDMYMDLRVNPEEFFDCDFLAKSKFRHKRFNRKCVTSLNISEKKRPIYLRMYDKLDEIGKKELCEAAYPGEKYVIRVEFQLKRRCLNSSGVTNWNSFEAMAVGMWDYLTATFFRQVVKEGDKNLSRRQSTEVWQIVHDNYKVYQTLDSYLFNFKKKTISVVHLLQMTAGIITSVAKVIEETEGSGYNSSDEIKNSFYERFDKFLKEMGIDLLERLEKKRGILYKPELVLEENK